MTTQQKTTEAKKTVKNSEIARAEAIEHSEISQLKIVEATALNNNPEQSETASLQSNDIQAQLNQLKEDIVTRIDTLKIQINSSQKHLQQLGNTLKVELGDLLGDITKIGVDLKTGVSQLSIKHKEQLTETIKKSKAETLEVWGSKSKS